ncbi:hypothetical protein GCK32_015520, partial [Trichostrongylus colubriformis]
MNRQYSCRRANGLCQISKNERYLCRLCRFNKCLALGMTPDNVQWNRDVISTTVEGRRQKKSAPTIDADDCRDDKDDYEPQSDLIRTAPTTYEQTCHQASTSDTEPKQGIDTGLVPIRAQNTPIRSTPMLALRESGKRVVFDISPMMNKLRTILSKFKPDTNIPDEPLLRMQHALLRHRRTQRCASDLKMVDSFNLMDFMSFWEVHIYATAEW